MYELNLFPCSVGNHMGNQNNGDWNNFAKFYPFNHQEHYHPYCMITDFNNQNQVRLCACTLHAGLACTLHAGLACTLHAGLACTLHAGLACILHAGLACTLHAGLACTLHAGLACTLHAGLACILHAGLACTLHAGLACTLHAGLACTLHAGLVLIEEEPLYYGLLSFCQQHSHDSYYYITISV